MWNKFIDKINQISNETHSDVLLYLNPVLEQLPLPIQRFDDPFFPFSKEIINATRDLVVGYILDFPAYLALGAAGAVALERTIGYIGIERMRILHGTFSGTAYSPMVERTAFDVDAITVASSDDLPHYLSNAPYGAFWVDSKGIGVAEGGVLNWAESEMHIYQTQALIKTYRITDDTVLYRGKLTDFSDEVRLAVKALL